MRRTRERALPLVLVPVPSASKKSLGGPADATLRTPWHGREGPVGASLPPPGPLIRNRICTSNVIFSTRRLTRL